MIVRLAIRTLVAHPIRTAVLAAGFGTGVSVMAILLGVAQIVLDQAREPALAGGGDVVVTGSGGSIPARVLLVGALQTPAMAGRVRAAVASSRSTLYLVRGDETTAVNVKGGVPSEERSLGDPEVSDIAAWTDTADDRAWTTPDPGDVLRAIDRFHPVPDVPEMADSWAEWLYFNGRSAEARFYLTFLVGPYQPDGQRVAGVRLQLERNGRITSYSAGGAIDVASVALAPDLSIENNHVRLSGRRYQLTLDLTDATGARLTGSIDVEGAAGQLMAPIEVAGARGWRTGYVVPVMSGTVGGTLDVNGERVDLDGGTGYHDHNWGFWKGVSWQWGQVQHDDLSIVFGRVFPPSDAADPDRIPGFLAVIGPDGPLGYATRVTIEETDAPDTTRPEHITIRGLSDTLDLTLDFAVESTETNQMPGPLSGSLDFLQMQGHYTATGAVGPRTLSFESAGSAETFRGD